VEMVGFKEAASILDLVRVYRILLFYKILKLILFIFLDYFNTLFC
jgi:hypothetical protein